MADELIEIVRISESPKSFDSAANFLRAIAELNEIKNRVWYEEKEYSILRIYGLFYHSRNKKVA